MRTCKACYRLHARAYVLLKIKQELMLIKVDRRSDEGDMVFLKVPAQLETLKMRKCEKLFPGYYGPFKILRKIGGVAYRLDLLKGIKAHPVFHVNKLKRTLHALTNVVSPNVLVELIKPPSAPHEPKRVLGF